MHHVRRLPAFVLAPLMLLCAVGGAALAQTATSAPPSAPQDLAAPWPMLAVAGANLLGVLIPRMSDELSFFHTRAGKAALTALGAFVSAIPSAIQAHGLCWAMLAWAALGCLGSLTSAMSTQAKSAAATLLPLLLLPALLASGCHTAGAQAFKACELGKLPGVAQDAFATGLEIAEHQNSIKEDLAAAALRYAPGQFECAMKALAVWLAGAPAPSTGSDEIRSALLDASTDSNRTHALEVVRAYLQEHPATSCAERPAG